MLQFVQANWAVISVTVWGALIAFSGWAVYDAIKGVRW